MTQDRLDEEYRTAERSKFTVNFRRNLRDTLGIVIGDDQMLSPDETDRLHTQFFRRFREQSVQHLFWKPQGVVGITRGIVTSPLREGSEVHIGDLWAILRAHGEQLKTAEVVMFYNHERQVGALRLNAATALRLINRLWPLVTYDFCLTTTEAFDGLCLEYNQYSDQAVYELSCWGALVPTSLRG